MYSPFSKTPVSAVKKQKFNKSSPYFSSSFRRSMTPSNSHNATFNRSLANALLEESTVHLTQCYGSPFPVLVTEALLNAERSSDISVKLETFGYASLVCGRQLLIWRYKQECDEDVVHCKELTLPPSDLAHKAELVHLFLTEDSRLPSALAVSPEGHVRYWPNINHEGSSVDALADLQGQECYSLTSVYPLGCILATTTSSLVIITPTIGEGQPSVICRTLTLPLGVLAGIGRKVSSFIFGVVPAQTAETKQLNRVLSVKESDDEYTLYVLSSNTLQKWNIIRKDRGENLDQLIFETDLDRELQQCYAETLYKEDLSMLRGLKTWCLDVQLCTSGVMLLTAAHRALGFSSTTVHYAFGILDTSGETPPGSFGSFRITQYTQPYQEVMEEQLLNYKFILPTPDSLSAYMFNSEKVLCVEIGVPELEMSETDFSASEDIILGSGTCEGLPLFFTKYSGIICFQPNQKALGDSRLIASMKDVSIRQTDPNEVPESLPAKFRTAMCSYCTGDLEKCEKIINEMLQSKSKESTALDEAVVGLSMGIIDDYPVSDPRWCESIPSGSISSSLIILYQLDDKLKAHECLLNFLKTFQLIEKLSMSKVGDYKVPTTVLLCEHAEKLMAAKALRLFLNDHNDVIETAVRVTLDKRNVEVKNHLTPQDVFFREVSAFHTIFPSLIEWEEEQLNSDESVSKTMNAIMTINKIFRGLLEAVSEYRKNKGDSYGLQESTVGVDFLPWTSREGISEVREQLKYQLDINVRHAFKLTDSIQIQGVLFQQYVEILDFYLCSYKVQMEHLKGEQKTLLKKEYERERASFLKPLLNVGQYERAAAIAEKYLDFDILIQICEETKNSDRLQRYMHQFSSQKFSEFVFKWYLDKGQKGKIFDKHLGQREVLGNFLQDHESLKWLYYIQEEKYDAAHATLKQLALNETQFLNRKKTLLSLSKLCAMVSDVPQSTKIIQIEAINLEHDLITHQEALPTCVVESYGIDPRNMRVFSPEELIEMYISDENATASAYDFKIALDLLNFMKKPLDDPEISNLRMHIWAKALLKDNWESLDINNPLDAIKETVFFQIIEIAFDRGIDIHDYMPDIDELLRCNELSELSDNPSIKFLLEAGYEHIRKIVI